MEKISGVWQIQKYRDLITLVPGPGEELAAHVREDPGSIPM